MVSLVDPIDPDEREIGNWPTPLRATKPHSDRSNRVVEDFELPVISGAVDAAKKKTRRQKRPPAKTSNPFSPDKAEENKTSLPLKSLAWRARQNARCKTNCRNRGLPIVCWIIPRPPAGGIEGGPEKLGKKVTLLFGASKSG